MIGKSEHLIPLIEHSLFVKGTHALESYKGKSTVMAVEIENRSSADLILENHSDYTFHSHSDVLTVDAFESKTVEVKILETLQEFELCFRVLNAVVAPRSHPEIKIHVNL